MSVNDLRIEKLCEGKHWVDSHVRFTRIGDIIRAKHTPDEHYEVISEPEWVPSDLMWNVDMKVYEGKK